jgi:hypothetical protein
MEGKRKNKNKLFIPLCVHYRTRKSYGRKYFQKVFYDRTVINV